MKYKKNVYQSMAFITQFAIHMLVPIFLCTFLGIYLDEKFHTKFLVILLFFVGALAGFRNIFRMARHVYNQKVEDADDEKKGR